MMLNHYCTISIYFSFHTILLISAVFKVKTYSLSYTGESFVNSLFFNLFRRILITDKPYTEILMISNSGLDVDGRSCVPKSIFRQSKYFQWGKI